MIGSCARVRGQDTGSLPGERPSPNRSSATPAPSVPGSHDATIASVSALRGVEDQRTARDDDHDAPLRRCAHVVDRRHGRAESCMSLTGRGCRCRRGQTPIAGRDVALALRVRRLADDHDAVASCGIGAEASWL